MLLAGFKAVFGCIASVLLITAQTNNAPLMPDAGCWQGFPGGEAKSWHLACCEIGGWPQCWTEELTADLCCNRTAAPGENVDGSVPMMKAEDGLEAIRRFLGFTEKELHLFLAGISDTTSASDSDAWKCTGCEAARGRDDRAGPAKRLRCYTPWDCSQEAIARFHLRGWETGLLPIRHPWFSEQEDPHFAMGLKMREDNDGWSPKGHERTFERVQMADWFEHTSAAIQSMGALPGEGRCLEWDASTYTRRFFKSLCKKHDMIMFEADDPRTEPREPAGSFEYWVDLHEADKVIVPGSIAVSICAQVFEHLRRPDIAMSQLYKLTAPGGFVIWSAPLFSMIHGAPHDYWRYTPDGAKLLAEEGGFIVLAVSAPGSLRELSGYLVGINAPYWSKEALVEEVGSAWPLQVYMLLHKPVSAESSST